LTGKANVQILLLQNDDTVAWKWVHQQLVRAPYHSGVLMFCIFTKFWLC